MRSDEDLADQPVYAAAQRFVDVALRRDGSLFKPDRSVWREPVLEDLHARFNMSPDQSSDRFEEKFKRQLASAPTATIQLAAEVVFVHFLVANDIGAPAKRRLVDLILSWSLDPISIPDDLIPAFSDGVCHSGVAFKTYRPHQLWFLIDFMRAWKNADRSDRDRLLKDPWEFKSFVESIPQTAAYTQRQGFLCLLFPDTFEAMVSREHKSLIIRAFTPDMARSLPDDPDRALAQIRAHLEPAYGNDFTFYDSPIVERWRRVRKASPAGPRRDQVEYETPDLLFRVYVPSGRLYASEADKLVSLFRDWVSGVRGRRIRQGGYQTRAGKVYEFFSEEGVDHIDLRQEFDYFSEFIKLCDSDPSRASEHLLKAGLLDRSASAELVARYGREGRRLRIDLRHERERRILSIRQSLESDLLDQGIDRLAAAQISTLIEESIPGESAVTPLALLSPYEPPSKQPLILNVNQQIFFEAVKGNIVQNVQGTTNLNPTAKELLNLIDRYGGDQTTGLMSDVHELEDPDAPLANRSNAKRRLVKFVQRIGDSVQGVATELLARYLETRIGL